MNGGLFIPSQATRERTWKIIIGEEFQQDLERLTRRDPVLKAAFQAKINEVLASPIRAGKRSKLPADSRHIHVKFKWVLHWRVRGDTVVLLGCGRHDESFRD